MVGHNAKSTYVFSDTNVALKIELISGLPKTCASKWHKRPSFHISDSHLQRSSLRSERGLAKA